MGRRLRCRARDGRCAMTEAPGLFAVADGVERSARLSECGTWRYYLARHWAPKGEALAFVMLNPSTADATVDDPTIRRCIGFARRDGYAGLVVVNLFALRSTESSTCGRSYLASTGGASARRRRARRVIRCTSAATSRSHRYRCRHDRPHHRPGHGHRHRSRRTPRAGRTTRARALHCVPPPPAAHRA
jgi:hypothetical protein